MNVDRRTTAVPMWMGTGPHPHRRASRTLDAYGEGVANDRPIHHRVGDAVDLGIDGLTNVSLVGSGGSSTVYRARQSALDRIVAVKVVHDAWNMDTLQRFEHERKVMGGLSGHSPVVPIFETGITDRGEPYLLMPHYRRGSLFRLMKDRGPLPWREATFILETLAQAVADSHREGIVHRDIKPGNVLLTDYLQPRLSDFGITLPAGSTTSGTSVAYTPSYSPPEAFQPGRVEPTTDVYSLGATLWALLAGRAPYTDVGTSVEVSEVMQRSASEVLDPPTGTTPKPLAELLSRAMAKAPEDRPTDAGVFASELRRAVRLSEPQKEVSIRKSRNREDLVVSSLLIGLVVAGALISTGSVLWWVFGS